MSHLSREEQIAILKEARDHVARRWTKQAYAKANGAVCAVGAIGRATYNQHNESYGFGREWYASSRHSHPLAQEVRDVLDKYTPSKKVRFTALSSDGKFEERDVRMVIENYNDADDTTKQDILNIFDKAIADLGGMS